MIRGQHEMTSSKFKDRMRYVTSRDEVHDVMQDLQARGSRNWTIDRAQKLVPQRFWGVLRQYFDDAGMLIPGEAFDGRKEAGGDSNNSPPASSEDGGAEQQEDLTKCSTGNEDRSFDLAGYLSDVTSETALDLTIECMREEGESDWTLEDVEALVPRHLKATVRKHFDDSGRLRPLDPTDDATDEADKRGTLEVQARDEDWAAGDLSDSLAYLFGEIESAESLDELLSSLRKGDRYLWDPELIRPHLHESLWPTLETHFDIHGNLLPPKPSEPRETLAGDVRHSPELKDAPAHLVIQEEPESRPPVPFEFVPEEGTVLELIKALNRQLAQLGQAFSKATCWRSESGDATEETS